MQFTGFVWGTGAVHTTVYYLNLIALLTNINCECVCVCLCMHACASMRVIAFHVIMVLFYLVS